MGFEKEQRPHYDRYGERDYLQAVTSTASQIVSYGLTTFSSTSPGAKIFKMDSPSAAGIRKSMVCIIQSGSSSSYGIIPTNTATHFATSQSAGYRKITFTSTGQVVDMIASSTIKYFILSKTNITLGSS